MKNLQESLGYKFNNETLLENALTHSSYANETHPQYGSNERLEFLGDAVLSVIVADYIYENFKNKPEGELTKLRASLCRHVGNDGEGEAGHTAVGRRQRLGDGGHTYRVAAQNADGANLGRGLELGALHEEVAALMEGEAAILGAG